MNNKNMKLYVLVILLIVLDQILKIGTLIYNLKIGNIIRIVQGEREKENLIYLLISFIAIVLIVRYIKSNNIFIKLDSKVLLSFAVAGIISNAIDRIWKGYVINYIDIPHFTAINLSYVYIIITWIGMAGILTRNTVKIIKERKKYEKGSNSNKSSR